MGLLFIGCWNPSLFGFMTGLEAVTKLGLRACFVSGLSLAPVLSFVSRSYLLALMKTVTAWSPPSLETPKERSQFRVWCCCSGECCGSRTVGRQSSLLEPDQAGLRLTLPVHTGTSVEEQGDAKHHETVNTPRGPCYERTHGPDG